MDQNSKQSLILERIKLENKAGIYKERAKFYLGILNHLTAIKKDDEIDFNDPIYLQVLHFGDQNPRDTFCIDEDLFTDLLKIQVNRFWNRHDQAMEAVLKINKALGYE